MNQLVYFVIINRVHFSVNNVRYLSSARTLVWLLGRLVLQRFVPFVFLLLGFACDVNGSAMSGVMALILTTIYLFSHFNFNFKITLGNINL